MVVNLPQDMEQAAIFFREYKSIQEKAVYLIGSYQEEHPFHLSYICRQYKIPRHRIGIVPYNMELQEAMNNGRLLQFLNRNYYQAEDAQNEYLLRYAKRAAQMIRKNALDMARQQRRKRVCQKDREIAFQEKK